MACDGEFLHVLVPVVVLLAALPAGTHVEAPEHVGRWAARSGGARRLFLAKSVAHLRGGKVPISAKYMWLHKSS